MQTDLQNAPVPISDSETEKEKRETEDISRQAAERQSPGGKVLYEAVVLEGRAELHRPNAGLFWSGLAAGLSMGFSVVGEGVLRSYLPDAPWRPLITKFGYSLGFVLVILGRQQLFTENTLTPVLPLLKERSVQKVVDLLRLWGIVLFSNMLGAVAISGLLVHSNAFTPEARAMFVQLGQEAMGHDGVPYSFGTIVIKGVFAGWLIAMIVWVLPFAEAARLWVIVFLTYIVGVAKLSHVVAGGVEVFAASWMDPTVWPEALLYVLAALLGNVIGGVTFVAALNHAQVATSNPTSDAKKPLHAAEADSKD
jgi:formate/nitrite transporter FocA (FNT family)